jgi:hypothetical protein
MRPRLIVDQQENADPVLEVWWMGLLGASGAIGRLADVFEEVAPLTQPPCLLTVRR